LHKKKRQKLSIKNKPQNWGGPFKETKRKHKLRRIKERMELAGGGGGGLVGAAVRASNTRQKNTQGGANISCEGRNRRKSRAEKMGEVQKRLGVNQIWGNNIHTEIAIE